MRILAIVIMLVFLGACSEKEHSVADSGLPKSLIVSAASSVTTEGNVTVAVSDITSASGVDSPLEVVGVYRDSTSYPKMFPEIILYKQDGQLAGIFIAGYQPYKSESLFFGVAPLNSIRLDTNGELTFSIPWDMGNPQEGFEKKHHYFIGKLQGDMIQGVFTSDWSSLTPPPIKAFKITPSDLKQEVLEYVRAKMRSASQNIQKFDTLLVCQNKRNQLPNDVIEIVGRWEKVESNGEHEWGYEIVLFQIGKELHGWIEDYSGLIGDGGIRYLISNIRLSKEKLNFKTHGRVEYEAIVTNSQLKLNSFGEVTLLDKMELPKVDWVWQKYQALLNAKCE